MAMEQIRVRHKKRGTTYETVGIAEVQSSSPIVEGDRIMIYHDLSSGHLWARPITEFNDGRFEEIQ